MFFFLVNLQGPFVPGTFQAESRHPRGLRLRRHAAAGLCGGGGASLPAGELHLLQRLGPDFMGAGGEGGEGGEGEGAGGGASL